MKSDKEKGSTLFRKVSIIGLVILLLMLMTSLGYDEYMEVKIQDTIQTIDTDRFCPMAVQANKSLAFESLYKELKQVTGVEQEDMRDSTAGIFVPMYQFFTEEKGLFFLTNPALEPEDFQYEKIRGCLWKYHIRG